MTTSTYAIRYAATNQLAAVVDAQDESAALEAHWNDVRADAEHRDAFRVSEVRRMTVRAWVMSGGSPCGDLAGLVWSFELRLARDAGVVLVDDDGEPLETGGGAHSFYATAHGMVEEGAA